MTTPEAEAVWWTGGQGYWAQVAAAGGLGRHQRRRASGRPTERLLRVRPVAAIGVPAPRATLPHRPEQRLKPRRDHWPAAPGGRGRRTPPPPPARPGTVIGRHHGRRPPFRPAEGAGARRRE